MKTKCGYCKTVFEKDTEVCMKCRTTVLVGRSLAPEPTHYPPGSVGKVEVLTERQSRGYLLFHPLDNKDLVTED